MSDQGYHPSGYYTFPFESSSNYEYTPHLIDVQENGYQPEMRTQLPPMSTFTTATSTHLEADYTFTQSNNNNNNHEINLEMVNSDNCLLAAVAAVAGDGNPMEEMSNTYHATNTSFTFAQTFSQTYMGNDIIFDGNPYMQPDQSDDDHQTQMAPSTYSQMETFTNHSTSNYTSNYSLNHELSVMQPANKNMYCHSQNVNPYDSQTGYTCLQSVTTPSTTDIFSALGINDSDIPMTAETLIDTYACDVVTPASLVPTPVPSAYSYDGMQSQQGLIMQQTMQPAQSYSQLNDVTASHPLHHQGKGHDHRQQQPQKQYKPPSPSSPVLPTSSVQNDIPFPPAVNQRSIEQDQLERGSEKIHTIHKDVHSQTIPVDTPVSKTVGTTTTERVQSPVKILTNSISSEVEQTNETHSGLLDHSSLVEEVKCFKCKLCEFISLDREQVSSHIKENHSQPISQINGNDQNKKSYVCSKCFKSLTSLSECREHMSSEHKLKLDKMWLQPVANGKNKETVRAKPILPNAQITANDGLRKNKPLSLSTTVNGHQSGIKKVKKKLRREKGTFVCEFKGCNIRFNISSNLEFHLKCHKDSGTGFTCFHCQVSFEHWSSMAGHIWRKHSLDMELHKCEHCSYRTYSSSVLENIHKRIHSSERNFVCDFCAKAFKNHKQLINHKVRHKTEPIKRPAEKTMENKVSHNCPICKRGFNDSRPLRVHMNMVHHKLRPFICSHCNHSAASRSALRTHLRSHTGEKPFKCEKCNYSTSDHNSLRRHKMRHSGERPYKCPFCTYACIQSSTYKQHLRNKHPGLCEGLMFMCSTCGFKTVNVDNYNTHMSEHKISPQNVSPTNGLSESVSIQDTSGPNFN